MLDETQHEETPDERSVNKSGIGLSANVYMGIIKIGHRIPGIGAINSRGHIEKIRGEIG